jgi:hypothetical protein
MELVSQYRVMSVSSSSLLNTDSTSPSQSLHARNFSTIHAASPAGESDRPAASVAGSRASFSKVTTSASSETNAGTTRSPPECVLPCFQRPVPTPR